MPDAALEPCLGEQPAHLDRLEGATNLGVQGTGANSAGSPADWTGTQAIAGHFNSGAGFNDVLDYNPATGSGSVLFGGSRVLADTDIRSQHAPAITDSPQATLRS
ncbi:hypothetical protein [Streptomyces sp. NPDC054962]